MKVLRERFPIDEFPNRIHRPGELFTRLYAVSVSIDGNSAEPIYIPLVRWQKRAGQLLIEINNERPIAYITVQRRAPYVHIFYFPWWLIDKDQDETI